MGDNKIDYINTLTYGDCIYYQRITDNIWYIIDSKANTYSWYQNLQDITDEVVQWLNENDIPTNFNYWTDDQKIMVKLRFCK